MTEYILYCSTTQGSRSYCHKHSLKFKLWPSPAVAEKYQGIQHAFHVQGIASLGRQTSLGIEEGTWILAIVAILPIRLLPSILTRLTRKVQDPGCLGCHIFHSQLFVYMKRVDRPTIPDRERREDELLLKVFTNACCLAASNTMMVWALDSIRRASRKGRSRTSKALGLTWQREWRTSGGAWKLTAKAIIDAISLLSLTMSSYAPIVNRFVRSSHCLFPIRYIMDGCIAFDWWDVDMSWRYLKIMTRCWLLLEL